MECEEREGANSVACRKMEEKVSKLSEFIRIRLVSFNSGEDPSGYGRIMQQLEKVSAPADMVLWIKALTGCVSAISNRQEELITWVNQWDASTPERVMDARQELVLSLLASNATFAAPILEGLLRSFSAPAQAPHYMSDRATVRPLPTHTHNTLKRALHVVPLSSQLVAETLKRVLMVSKGHELVCVTANALSMLQYVPTISQSVLEVVIERMVTEDVHITLDNIVDTEEDLDAVFTMDMEVNESHINTLDLLMMEMMRFVDGRAEEMVDILIPIFTHYILPARECKAVQFLLFYLCGLHAPTSQRFVEHLLQLSRAQQVAPQIRCFSLSHLGGYVSRYKAMEDEISMSILSYMAQWAIQYSEQCQIQVIQWNHHPVYYHCIQQILYILCFKHHLLGQAVVLKELHLDKLLLHPLAPLNMISPGTASQFMIYLRHYGLEELRDALEAKSLGSVPCSALEHYPFDPYILPITREFITPLYADWKPLTGADISEDLDPKHSYTPDSWRAMGVSPFVPPHSF